jgi:hypothetical protein
MSDARTQSPRPASREGRWSSSAELPRLLLTREESARALGMSLSHFQRHVQSQLRCVFGAAAALSAIRLGALGGAGV